MTIYLCVVWCHELEEEPYLLYSEIDDERREVRKVERYRDGRVGFADGFVSSVESVLSETPLPSLAEINAQSNFRASVISRAEFEAVWKAAAAEPGPASATDDLQGQGSGGIPGERG